MKEQATQDIHSQLEELREEYRQKLQEIRRLERKINSLAYKGSIDDEDNGETSYELSILVIETRMEALDIRKKAFELTNNLN